MQRSSRGGPTVRWRRVVLCIFVVVVSSVAAGGVHGARGATTDKMNVVLVLDSSGSMRWNDQGRIRESAAQLFIDLARPFDRIGLVEFADTGVVVEPLGSLDTPGKRERLKQAVTKIADRVQRKEGGKFEEYTDINAGLEVALGELRRGADPEDAHAVILLTDGFMDPNETNTRYQDDAYRSAVAAKEKGLAKEALRQVAKSTLAAEVLPQYVAGHWPVYAIGLQGTKREVDIPLLQEIAVVTGGAAFQAIEGVDLLRVYSQILSELGKKSLEFLPVTPTKAGEVVTQPIAVDTHVRGLEIAVSSPRGAETPQVAISDPSGRDVTRAADKREGAGYQVFSVPQPALHDNSFLIANSEACPAIRLAGRIGSPAQVGEYSLPRCLCSGGIRIVPSDQVKASELAHGRRGRPLRGSRQRSKFLSQIGRRWAGCQPDSARHKFIQMSSQWF
ncbi:MAG: VWA domain-containing protein [Candidatus Binatia bacterium]